MNPPILLCGCPGSGTSLVAKILRHSGLFLGDDAGPIDARKYHESQCFMRYNIQFLGQTIDFPHAPKSVEQFQSHIASMKQNCEKMADMVDRERLLSEYCGDLGHLPPNLSWGWKDPRNSATAMIWKRVFPHLRLIVISRTWRWRNRWKSGGSDSGNWYRKESTRKLRELYDNPVGIDQQSVLRVDVDRLTTDADFFKSVAKWCNLSVDPGSSLDELMEQVGLER